MSRVLSGRYELLDKIGDGGMAVTYRARDHVLDRMVAVKVMREHLSSDPQFQERFRREAQAAANLSHENIAGVHDSGQDGDSHYIVMELVDGEDLKQRLRRAGKLPVPLAIDIATQVARALEAAHARGIVHRDVKPHNILLTADGKVKVTDFGIAKAASSSSQTETGTIMGSVHYFSPEQARGEAAGPQADVYSLGVVLFEMLTGRLPFDGENPVAVAHKQIYDPPPLPSHFSPEVPPELDALVLRCLAKDLTRRYASATELLNYLGSFARRLDGQATVVRPPAPAPAIEQTVVQPAYTRPTITPAPPPPPPERGSRLLVGVVLLVVLLVIGAVGGTVWVLGHAPSDGTLPTPDLYQLSLDSAKAVVKNRGLKLRISEEKEYSEYVARGLVLRQDPPPDRPVRPGGTVSVWLSLGPRFAVVPDVSRMAVARATEGLQAAGLKAGEVTEAFDDSVPAGYVASTDPPVGAKAERGSKVAIVVSKGPEPAVAPPADDGATPQPDQPAGSATDTFTYTVPGSGTKQVQLRVEVEDDNGRRVLYDQAVQPGFTLPAQAIQRSGKATVRVFIDNQPMESRVYGQ